MLTVRRLYKRDRSSPLRQRNDTAFLPCVGLCRPTQPVLDDYYYYYSYPVKTGGIQRKSQAMTEPIRPAQGVLQQGLTQGMLAARKETKGTESTDTNAGKKHETQDERWSKRALPPKQREARFLTRLLCDNILPLFLAAFFVINRW